MSVVAHIRDLQRSYTLKGVLNGIDLDIREGEFIGLIGRSGSGKSTLLRAIADLDHEAIRSGELRVTPDRSVVFQDARLLPWRNVLDNVLFGLAGPARHERARQALAEVELAGREHSWPSELSGGEQQRVALARSLVREPRLLLADEPFGALDALTRIRMHALFKRLSATHHPAVLLVTHDVDEAIELSDRVIVLDEGRIAQDIQVALPAEGTPRLARIAELRQTLLRYLGVELPRGDSESSRRETESAQA